MPRADGRADGPPGWGVSSSRRLAGATPEELTAAQARDGIGAAVQVEEEQLRIRRSAAPARGRLGRDRICLVDGGLRHRAGDDFAGTVALAVVGPMLLSVSPAANWDD